MKNLEIIGRNIVKNGLKCDMILNDNSKLSVGFWDEENIDNQILSVAYLTNNITKD